MFSKIICENEDNLIKKLASLIENISNEAITTKNTFKVGVSGGSLVKFLTIGLQGIKSDFSKWKIFFCDERVVPINDPDSTYGIYKRELVGKVFSEDNFIQIKQGATVEEAAKDYNQKLISTFGNDLPRFDLLLLGMGPDGHTCSLFPNHKLLDEKTQWVMPISDSPKPPPERVTLTFPVINNAQNCVFAMCGEGKAEMVKRILEDKEDLPATRVQPTNGNLYWILDESAAKLISK